MAIVETHIEAGGSIHDPVLNSMLWDESDLPTPTHLRSIRDDGER